MIRKRRSKQEGSNGPHEYYLSFLAHSETESQQGTHHNTPEDQLVQRCHQHDGEVPREAEQDQ